jgi:hypothetical protein
MEAQLVTRIPLALRKQYKRACKRHKRSMNAQTELLIEEWLQKQK